MNAAVPAVATAPFNSRPSISHGPTFPRNTKIEALNRKAWRRGLVMPDQNESHLRSLVCHAARRKPSTSSDSVSVGEDGDGNLRKVIQAILWVAEGVYVVWLFLLPYAPGDPVWAISSETVDSLIGLSLNFFFILPLLNSELLGGHESHSNAQNAEPNLADVINFDSCSIISVFTLVGFGIDLLGRVVGIHYLEGPVLHPMAEGLFNFVIGWTFMFAPLLFTDAKRNRYKGSLEVLWGLQMFLTNTFLIPYMAIRLNEANSSQSSGKHSQLGTIMTNGASVVGLIGGAACLISILWALYGRADGGFGSITDRWEFLVNYLGSERLAYAFIWDISLYIIFQPWLIGENLQNVQKNKVGLVNYLRFFPVVGLVAYLLCLNLDEEL